MQQLWFRLYLFFIFMFLITSSYVFAEKIRVLYILSSYPQTSETYMENEIASMYDDYEIAIISLKAPNMHQEKYYPYVCVDGDKSKIDAIIEDFKPHVMHTHWFLNILIVEALANKHQIPFTIRTHSFDILKSSKARLRAFCNAANSPWCLRVLCFPAFKELLIGHGLDNQKMAPCWPVVDYERFFNDAQRVPTKKILGIGAALPKKDHKSFIDLAHGMKGEGFEFNLYLCGHDVANMEKYNKSLGCPASIKYVLPELMPQVYRDHDWLVFTADTEINAIGLPVSLAEAQASGIGICLQELPGRMQEHLDYLGGAGFFFKSVDDLPAILREPYPNSMRLLGLSNAAKCDIKKHNILLKEVWDTCGTSEIGAQS